MPAPELKSRATAFFKAIERFDIQTLDSLLAVDAVQIELPNRLKPEGGRKDRAGMLAGLDQGKAILTAQSCRVKGLAETDAEVFVEWVWEGEIAIPLCNLQPGDRMRADCIAVIRFSDGLISQVRNYDCYVPF